MSVEELEEVCAELHRQQVETRNERVEATKVLRVKLKERAAMQQVEEAQGALKEAQDALPKPWYKKIFGQ